MLIRIYSINSNFIDKLAYKLLLNIQRSYLRYYGFFKEYMIM